VGTGEVGPIVKRMQEIYFNIARGGNDKYSAWLTPVY
jgi:branched-chain amino acid aminotransferase